MDCNISNRSERVLARPKSKGRHATRHSRSHNTCMCRAVLAARARLRAQVKRDSFAHYFSQQKEQNEVTWTPTPLEALLDVDQVIEAWRLRGTTIHRARPAHAALGVALGCTSGRS